MKLSVKFFCTAYIIVLLTTGLSSSWLIDTSKNSLVNSRVEQTNVATKYAIDSFISFSETNKAIIESQLSVYLFSENEYIEFTYEAQTQTLISFVYDRISDEVENTIDIIDLQNALNKYYKNKLQLSEYQLF